MKKTLMLPMSSRNFYIGLFLVTACTLMLQVIQTRILSVVAWYHLAFFAISMAMFGLTAGAVWVYKGQDRFSEKNLSYHLSHYSLMFAFFTALCLAVQMTLAPVVTWSFTFFYIWIELALCLAVPFFFSGIVVSLALTRSPFAIGRVYAVDLIGAAVGCLGVMLVLEYTDGPSAVLWVASIAALASVFFERSSIGTEPETLPSFASLSKYKIDLLLILVVCAILNGLSPFGLQPIVAKGKFEGGPSHLFRQWNSFSRVAVYDTEKRRPILWAASPVTPHFPKIEQREMNIDGDAGTVATAFDGDFTKVGYLKYDVTNLAYFLPHLKRSAVIGVGGGRDVLSAAAFGIKDITGIELNPIFIELLTNKEGYSDFTNLDSLEGLKLIVDDGRSWFAGNQEPFDIIQMSLIDTWAATGAGAFSLSENGLYTVEAWKIFLNNLTPNGVYTVSRWFHSEKPSETGRMLSLAVAALYELGVDNPKQHIFLANQAKIATIVISRSPFSAKALRSLEMACTKLRYKVLLNPNGESGYETLDRIASAPSIESLEEYTSNQLFDLTPATDDRPFFFNQLTLNKPVQTILVGLESLGADSHLGGVRRGNYVATLTLVILFLVSLALVVVTIVLPMRSAVKDVGLKLVIGGTLYFFLIGVGFMTVEIGLLQRMSVFLGHPIYSLSVLLFTLILSSGLGSFWSDKLMLNTRLKLTSWAILTGLYILLLPHWLPQLLYSFDGSDLLTRIALCIASIAPAGVCMGFGFPTGMRLVSAIDSKPTPWFWGINGAAGVLASVVAISSSIAFGISGTLLIGAVCYLLLIPASLLLKVE